MVCLGNMCMATLHTGDNDVIIIIIIITTTMTTTMKHGSLTNTVQYPLNVMPWEVLLMFLMQTRPVWHVIIT
jgi:hypothetical protein